VIAGGGTAGHVEPGLAVAQELRKALGANTVIEFLGTKGGVETDLVPRAGYTLHTIKKAVMPRTLNLRAVGFPFTFLRSISQARRVVRGADVVIGFGGYVCAPAYLAAWISRTPILVHEANAKAGFANRLGVALGGSVAITFESARQTSRRWRSAVTTGLPIKSEIIELARLNPAEREKRRVEAVQSFGLIPAQPVVLVFGGSLGARRINEAIGQYRIGAINSLNQSEFAANTQWIHAVGSRSELPASTDTYKALPYIYQMETAYAAADLVISRSGAVTCQEVAAISRRAIFVPLPIGNGEQAHNAADLVSQGLAEIVENQSFTSDWLERHLEQAVEQAIDWRTTASKTTALVSMNAARLIGELAISTMTRVGR